MSSGLLVMRTLLLGLVTSLALIAQGTRGDYSFSGTVLNSVTGEPIKGARVTLMELPQGDRATEMPGNAQETVLRTAMAGPGGGYAFAGLPAGQYAIGALKPGFIDSPADSGTPPNNIALSASVSGYVIRLSPLGVIEGKLVDQRGDPLSGVSVMVFDTTVMDGLRHPSSVRSVTTGDRGQFRFWDLAPRKFYVKVMGRAGGTSTYVGGEAVRYDSWEGFRPAFFGGARDLGSATPIAIAAGTHVRADFTLATEPAFKIRGSIGNYPSGEPVTFELLEGDPDVESSRVSLDSTTGKFEIDGVLPGQYTLRVTQGRARGETAVTVKGGDVEGISLALVPAVTVTVVERFAGLPAGRGGAEEDTPARNGSCSAYLAAPGIGESLTGSRTGGGKLQIEGVHGGQYQVTIHCANRYVVSAVSGGADLLSNPVLTVQPGVTPPPIELGTKSGGGQLHGKLAVSGHLPGAGVLLVPAFPASTGPVTTQVYWISETPDALEFGFQDLAPGDYLVYAFSDILSVEYRNPAFMGGLAGGTGVRIEDGKTAEIALSSVVR